MSDVDEDVTAVISERTTVLLEAKLRDRDKLKTERMQRFAPLVKEWAEDEEGLALMAMLLDDFYQQSLAQSTPAARTETKTRWRQKIRQETQKTAAV